MADLGQARDRRTGRYVHVWGWQGFDSKGQEWARCEHCGKWRGNGKPTTKDPGPLTES